MKVARRMLCVFMWLKRSTKKWFNDLIEKPIENVVIICVRQIAANLIGLIIWLWCKSSYVFYFPYNIESVYFWLFKFLSIRVGRVYGTLNCYIRIVFFCSTITLGKWLYGIILPYKNYKNYNTLPLLSRRIWSWLRMRCLNKDHTE